jgi:hypothetical protein
MVMKMGFITANSTCIYQAAGAHSCGTRTTCVSKRLEVSDRDIRRLQDGESLSRSPLRFLVVSWDALEEAKYVVDTRSTSAR